jgi:hypothetical protein
MLPDSIKGNTASLQLRGLKVGEVLWPTVPDAIVLHRVVMLRTRHTTALVESRNYLNMVLPE